MAKSKKAKPSFDPVGATATGEAPPAEWVYRSDASGDAKTRRAPRARARKSAVEPPAPAGDRLRGSQALVDRYAKYAAAAGLVPVPVVDVAAITGVQVALVRALADQYGVDYSPERGKSLVAALVGGVMPALAGHQMLKIVGPLFGMVSVAGFAMASTYAVGRLFIGHFESGGTLLDVDVENSRRRVAADMGRS